MLHPSYSDLMNVVNSNVEEGEEPVVNSRYSIVMATAKRARQIIGGKKALVNVKGAKPLSIAVEELNQGKNKDPYRRGGKCPGNRYRTGTGAIEIRTLSEKPGGVILLC